MDKQRQSCPGMGEVVDRNIRALVERRRRELQTQAFSGKVATAVTRFTGSMSFVYLHLAAFGLWIGINLGWLPIMPKFDPTFVILAMAASVEAIFLSTFVLITQNRMAELAEQRSELDLQISLLSEHEITKLIGVVAQIAKKFEIDVYEDPEIMELLHDVHPDKVLDKIESVTGENQPR